MKAEAKQAQEKPIPEMGNRTWSELEVIPSESGHILFQDQLRERTPGGEWKTIPVRVRIPRPKDNILARADARKWFGELKNLDPEKDADLFEEMEQLCLLAKAIRTFEPPHPQLATHDELASDFDEATLQDILGRISVYRQLLDPRDSNLTEDELWTKILAVVRVGHLGPLTGIAGHEQPSCVLFMASQALLSPKGRSFVESCGILMPEVSAPGT